MSKFSNVQHITGDSPHLLLMVLILTPGADPAGSVVLKMKSLTPGDKIRIQNCVNNRVSSLLWSLHHQPEAYQELSIQHSYLHSQRLESLIL